VKDRHSLDGTGLQQHRSVVDLMRYSALNQGADNLATYAGFVPADIPISAHCLIAITLEAITAMSSFMRSRYTSIHLQPPRNPNKLDLVAARGQKIFKREGCPTCHTPPLYTK
jgi:hypothetical protein